MLVETRCPHCHFRCTWSDASQASYVRCSRCNHVFPIATPTVAVHHPPRRRRRQPLPIVPLYLLGGLLCLVLAGGVWVKNYRQVKTLEAKVTQEKFRQLRIGMRELEALRILGAPSRTDNSMAPKVGAHAAHRFTVDERQFERRCFWEEGDNLIWIEFFQGLVKDFGCTIEGERIGPEIKESLAKERQVIDDE
jgi:hypothetical protein